jgi:hypothetical protein
MKQVFLAMYPGEAYVVRALLESEGIAAILQGYPPGGAPGALPTVWVVEDSQVEKALATIATYEQGGESGMGKGQAWSCPACGKKNESQFTECWHCGTSRSKED